MLWGADGWFGGLEALGVKVIFGLPGMVIATLFVTLPFVVREVEPVLREIGTEQEQAAATLGASAWQTFTRITLPALRWGLTYGIVLTAARALGEFGAVIMVSSSGSPRPATRSSPSSPARRRPTSISARATGSGCCPPAPCPRRCGPRRWRVEQQ